MSCGGPQPRWRASRPSSQLLRELGSGRFEVPVAKDEQGDRNQVRDQREGPRYDLSYGRGLCCDQDLAGVLDDLGDWVERRQREDLLGQKYQGIDDRAGVEQELQKDLPDVPQVTETNVERGKQ